MRGWVRACVRACVCVCVCNTQSLARISGRLTWARIQQLQRAALPITTSECSVLVCPKNGKAASVLFLFLFLFFFTLRIDVDAYDCTRGLFEHRKRVCTRS